MSKETFLTITPKLNNERADKAIISLLPSLSRSFIQQLIKEGAVTVNGKGISKNYLVKSGDMIKVILPQESELIIEAEDLPLDIVYEDDDLLVVN